MVSPIRLGELGTPGPNGFDGGPGLQGPKGFPGRSNIVGPPGEYGPKGIESDIYSIS